MRNSSFYGFIKIPWVLYPWITFVIRKRIFLKHKLYMCISTTHAKFGVNGYSYMEMFPKYLLQFGDCNRTTSDKNSSLRTMWPTPSKSPATGGTKRLTQSVKHRCRVIPRKAHPAREWGTEPQCWCEHSMDKCHFLWPSLPVHTLPTHKWPRVKVPTEREILTYTVETTKTL